MYVANQKTMQLLDRYTMEQYGLPGIVLMENAGNAVVNEIIAHFPQTSRITIIAGGGNNGGDGFVIARRLYDYGYPIMLVLTVPEDKLKGDAKIHFTVYKNRSLPLLQYNENNAQEFQSYVKHSDVIVDALLGTGISGEVRSPFREIIEIINRSEKIVYAVDIPSGVSADTGIVTNLAVKATKTITFAMPKIGFFIGDGPNYIGEWKVADISVPSSIVHELQLSLPKLLDGETAKCALPKRVKHGHKGTFGHALVIGGCKNYVGAPTYTAKAAFYSGIGLITLAIPEELYPIIASTCHESLFLPLEDIDGAIDAEALRSIDFSKYNTITIGPGLGREVDGDEIFQTLFKKLTNQTLVVDADGLYFLKSFLHQLHQYKGNIILTPHPGEMANLTGHTVKEIERNRLDIAKTFATEYGIHLILKGHRPIIATKDGELWINPYGNDALGKGGSGDVLTGLVTSFVTQNPDPLKAMLSASYYHATCAEKLGNQSSTFGVTPMDIIHHIPSILK